MNLPRSVTEIVLTDTTYSPRERPNALERLGLALINDRRDLPFLRLMVVATLVVVPYAIVLYLPGQPQWWSAVPYLALVLGYFLGPYILMLHNTSHRSLFRPRYAWMRFYIPWVLGPFFGQTPETYFAHHIDMHHPENNQPDDLSCTMRYRRDSLLDFLKYFARFFFGIVPELSIYMWKRGRLKMMRRLLIGELSFYCLVGVLLWLNPMSTLVVFVIPWVVTRFAMMTGNWAQHAFIDPADPANCYRNSITCINTVYNRRCFNDGYHIGHHLKANRHWTEMPAEFLANRERYARERAIVFQGIDYFFVWLFLMLKRYDLLARHYVDVGNDRPSSREIEELLRSRTRPIVGA